MQAAARQGTELRAEWRVGLPDGQERWLLSRGQPMRDATGRIARYLGIVLDVTARMQTREAPGRLRDILAEGQRIAHLGTFECVAATRATVRSEEEYRIYGLDPSGPSPPSEVMLAKSIHPDDATLVHRTFSAALQAGAVYELEHRIVRPDGSVRWVYDRAHPHFDAAGALVRYVGTTLDITDRKAAEAALRASLAEKEVLLREVHHRVKNTLQIVASLLNLEASRASAPEAQAVLRDTRARVQAMALLHEALYRSTTLAQIDLAAYVPELVRHLQRSVGDPAGRVAVEAQVAAPGLPLEQAAPCGLVINELVSNALKRAFPEERRGAIRVDIEAAGPHKVAVQAADDGVGLPPGCDPAHAATLGLRLVANRANQLQGRMTAENRPGAGAVFRVVFPSHDGEAPAARG